MISRSIMFAAALGLPLAGGGCGDDDAAGTADGMRTLTTCETAIAATAPAFYQTYFRCVTVTGTPDVTITTRNLPPHQTSYYADGDPNWIAFDTSRGAAYFENPNTLVERDLAFTIPAAPIAKGIAITAAGVDGVVGTSNDEYPLGAVGVALDSVALYNPLAGPGDDIEDEKFTFDTYDAHPGPDGAYHYHTASPGPLEVLALGGLTTSTTPGAAAVELFGLMCDGTVVLGCTELDGAAPGGALDAQGGHVHDLADADGVAFANRYHVHVCPSSATGRRYTPELQYYSTCTR